MLLFRYQTLHGRGLAASLAARTEACGNARLYSFYVRFIGDQMSTSVSLQRQEKESVAPASDVVLRLLIINDDRESLDLIREALKDGLYEVFITADAAEGLDILRRKHPHIVLLDLLMPQIGGMEMLETILEIDPGVDVILITERYITDAAVEAIKKGACDYLTKPISAIRLRERMEHCDLTRSYDSTARN